MRQSQNWNQPCPNKECECYGQMNRGNISSIATYPTQSGVRRIFKCKRCQTSFSETRDTVFYDLRTSEEKVMMALKMLLCKVELTSMRYILGVSEETLLEWLERAASKAEEINQHLLKEGKVTQVQLDEMWSFIRCKKAKEASANGESLEESAEGRQWVWVSYAPEFRLLLATYVGPRTYASALQLIVLTAAVVLGVPVFFSDGFSCYLSALLAVYHQCKAFPPTGKPGRPKKPIQEPDPQLVYAQVVKHKKNGRLSSLTESVRWGTARLKELGFKISTSLLERFNLTLRHALAPLTRKCWAFCKSRTQLRRRVTFYQAFYNVARPHQSLRLPLHALPAMEQPRFHQKWQPRTPAMAAGLTDHVWSFRELLTAKFEPILHQSITG